MNAERIPEAVGESIERLPEILKGMTRREAERSIGEQFEAMKQDGRLLLMSDEEERMIRAFRRFKMNARKHGEVFKWQTRLPEFCEESRLIVTEETALIRDPQEVA